MAFDKNKYHHQWQKENKMIVAITVNKGKTALINAVAKDLGVSRNRLVIDALRKKYPDRFK